MTALFFYFSFIFRHIDVVAVLVISGKALRMRENEDWAVTLLISEYD